MATEEDVDTFLNEVIESTAIVPTDDDLLEILDESNVLYAERANQKLSNILDSMRDNMGPLIKGIIGSVEKTTGLSSSCLNDDHLQFISNVAGEVCDAAKAVCTDREKTEKLEAIEREKRAYIISFMRKLEETYPEFASSNPESDEGTPDNQRKLSSDMRCMTNAMNFLMVADVSNRPELEEMLSEYNRTINGFEQRQMEIVAGNSLTFLNQVANTNGMPNVDLKKGCIIS